VVVLGPEIYPNGRETERKGKSIKEDSPTARKGS
jgi:hypothetical protein